MSAFEDNISTVARREVAEERVRALVAAEKVRIYAGLNRSPWLRFLAWLPFTITLTWKN